MRECMLLTAEEYDDRRTEGRKRGDWAMFLEPGMMWFDTESWDHTDPDMEQYLPFIIREIEQSGAQPGSLSLNYFKHHAKKRDPLIIALPDGTKSCVDKVATNVCLGWNVTGRAPFVTVTPRIVTPRNNHFRIAQGQIHAIERER